ncbi:MFS transporter [Frigidibacter sp. ROC022]|uniref:MFS transporter n=1 Tax=Frigidibacter sp. ROC022 TaxID=2971796 RepID=UPI00215B675D|nr:MFS transporter [Frigidibacter sp. ROC022]MCR8724892.1 MFS transporter [Frigidibacter sp. ROC022]
MDHPLHDSRYSWFRLAASLLIGLIGNVGMWSIVLILPDVQAEFAVDRGTASLPYTLTMIGFALGNLLIGRAVDRWGMTASLIGAALILGGGFSLAALAPSVAVLALVQLLIGFGSGAAFGPLIADVSHWFLKRRGIAVAVAASGNYLSGALWPLILSPVLAAWDWRQAYLGLAGVVVVSLVPLSFLLTRRMTEEGAAHAAASRPAMATGLPTPVLILLLCLAGIGCCVAMSMPQVHIVALCVDLGYGAAAGANMLSLMLFGGVVSRLASGFLADRLGGIRTLLIGSGLQGMALFLYLPFDGLATLNVVSLVFGLSQGGIVPSYAVIVREYLPAREAGKHVGLVISTTILGMALGGWMSGYIFDLTGSYQMAVLNGIGWNVLNIGIMLLILQRSRPRGAVAA